MGCRPVYSLQLDLYSSSNCVTTGKARDSSPILSLLMWHTPHCHGGPYSVPPRLNSERKRTLHFVSEFIVSLVEHVDDLNKEDIVDPVATPMGVFNRRSAEAFYLNGGAQLQNLRAVNPDFITISLTSRQWRNTRSNLVCCPEYQILKPIACTQHFKTLSAD